MNIKTVILAASMTLPVAASAAWLPVDLGDLQSFEIEIGSKSKFVGNTAIFWLKGAYILDGKPSDYGLDYGSWLIQVAADCGENDYLLLHKSTYGDLKAKSLLSTDNATSSLINAGSETIIGKAITMVCREDSVIVDESLQELQILVSDDVESSIGECFPDDLEGDYA